MITITKERLLTIKQWRETYGPDSNVVLPAEEAEELARIALASLEAEPVAWMRDDADGREYNARNEFSGGGGGVPGFAPIFPDTCYHLTHYWLAAVDIPVASDNPVHYADAIRYNARTPLQGSLLPLTRLVWA